MYEWEYEGLNSFTELPPVMLEGMKKRKIRLAKVVAEVDQKSSVEAVYARYWVAGRGRLRGASHRPWRGLGGAGARVVQLEVSWILLDAEPWTANKAQQTV